MHENDPNLISDIAKWIINAVFAIVLAFGARSYTRSMNKADEEAKRVQRQLDEQERRLRIVEKDSVTDEELRRIETKMDEQYRHITARLDAILERSK